MNQVYKPECESHRIHYKAARSLLSAQSAHLEFHPSALYEQ